MELYTAISFAENIAEFFVQKIDGGQCYSGGLQGIDRDDFTIWFRHCDAHTQIVKIDNYLLDKSPEEVYKKYQETLEINRQAEKAESERLERLKDELSYNEYEKLTWKNSFLTSDMNRFIQPVRVKF